MSQSVTSEQYFNRGRAFEQVRMNVLREINQVRDMSTRLEQTYAFEPVAKERIQEIGKYLENAQTQYTSLDKIVRGAPEEERSSLRREIIEIKGMLRAAETYSKKEIRKWNRSLVRLRKLPSSP